jgi:hypothetical protein
MDNPFLGISLPSSGFFSNGKESVRVYPAPLFRQPVLGLSFRSIPATDFAHRKKVASLDPKWVVAIHRNRWPFSTETGGRFTPKYALAAFQADLQPGGRYRLTKPSDDLKLILESFNVNADLRLPTISDLRKLKYSFDCLGIV